MSYSIKISGKSEFISVSDIQGERIKERWFNWIDRGKPRDGDSVFEAGDWSGLLSQIKTVEKDKEVDVKKQDFVKLIEEHKKERQEFLNRTLEEKAQNLKFFSLLWWGFTGKNGADKETRDKAVELQKQFYLEKPNRTIPDPTIYKPIIKEQKMFKHLMPTIERIVMEDKTCAGE